MKWYRILLLLPLLLTSGFAKQAHAAAAEQWTWPVSGKITDYFGTRSGKHYGLDIAAPTGTPIVAAAAGTVTRSYYSDSYGHVVFIRHRNGYEAVYAHMNRRLVKEGQQIRRGQRIGEVGNTGHSHGAHLHFEVHRGDWNFEKTNAVNPLLVLGEPPHQVASSMAYVVQKGDTLSAIAKRFGTTVRDLQNRNRLRGETIYPTQRLMIN
ncbi:peptidoglycan DD-metalloendopeptidase family protein [Ectobacillus ponti]|uniref:Peptidoglycan DD-metalloendopeptidase family protein n=1 Tax=Ectobacillus ponti TaxID=2961894 RepID=A0AA41X4E4_9BACI|nr:peptidoglycan DD-metalloendopeptidase family protein [Ectobacillus ponti]MCP8968721.1 peptidoglycan DD-metalloendopeptidase family protein [Ectobacillus ponti]